MSTRKPHRVFAKAVACASLGTLVALAQADAAQVSTPAGAAPGAVALMQQFHANSGLGVGSFAISDGARGCRLS